MSRSPIPERLHLLRQHMQQEGIDAWITTTSDPHLSEYIPDYWKVLQWLSGFTGSMAQLLITQNFAGLWVDSRYWEQAEQELKDTGINVMRLGSTDPFAQMTNWFTHFAPQAVIGLNTQVVAVNFVQNIIRACEKHQLHFEATSDLCGSIWHDRPALVFDSIFSHPLSFATQTAAEKIDSIRQVLASKAVDWCIISSLDDIAWTVNLRGSDIAHNPLFHSYLAINSQHTYLFCEPKALSDTQLSELAGMGIAIESYTDFFPFLATLQQQTILIDPQRTPYHTFTSLANQNHCVTDILPTVFLKSQKNDTQLSFVRQTMIEDGIALCEFFAWLDERLLQQPALQEWEVDELLTAYRAKRPHFITTSFNTIAGYNANGSLPHYRATQQQSSAIQGNGLLLIDSGGQYLGGTTDITRMIPIGTPTWEQKKDCTTVLKGLIALSNTHFPRGISSPLLDAIARAPLWQAHIDYGHGTGHGVGYCLNVHEGPQAISFRTPATEANAMQPGMITSIEPGIYRPGQWGIRIENLVANVYADTNDQNYLRFDTLTLCPIDTRCLLPELLAQTEKEWLNAYHTEVRQKLASHLQGTALQWLLKRTQLI